MSGSLNVSGEMFMHVVSGIHVAVLCLKSSVPPVFKKKKIIHTFMTVFICILKKRLFAKFFSDVKNVYFV